MIQDGGGTTTYSVPQLGTIVLCTLYECFYRDPDGVLVREDKDDELCERISKRINNIKKNEEIQWRPVGEDSDGAGEIVSGDLLSQAPTAASLLADET